MASASSAAQATPARVGSLLIVFSSTTGILRLHLERPGSTLRLRRWALHAFIASLAGLLASLVYTFGLSNGAEVMGGQTPIQFVILAVCLFLVWYAWTAARRGWLR